MKYPIEIQRESDYNKSYFYRTKNSKGQTLLAEFYEYDKIKGKSIFNFTFSIKQKRRYLFPYDQITGKDDLSSLIWALNYLKETIKFLKKYYPKSILEVWGDNKRKQRIYNRYLIPLGFKKIQTKDHTLRLNIESVKLF